MIFHRMSARKRKKILDSMAADLAAKKNVAFAYVFGSFKDYDDEVGFRDIDIAVYFKGVQDVLGEAIALSADLGDKYARPVECIPLNEVPAHMRYRVFREGMELFCGDEDARDDLVEKTVLETLDFMPMRTKALRELVKL